MSHHVSATFRTISLNPEQWVAVAAVVQALAAIVLVVVTGFYVRYTHRLVEATQHIEFDVVVHGFSWVHHPHGSGPDRRLGPFPRTLRITNRGVHVWVDRVHYDATRAGGHEEAGQVGDADPVDPPQLPTSLYPGAVLYCGFDGGSWGLADEQEEVAVSVTFRRHEKAEQETYVARATIVAHDRAWGHDDDDDDDDDETV